MTTYDDITQLGFIAYNNDGPRAAIQHPEVAALLEGRAVGDPVNLAVLSAFNKGWNQAADEAAWAAIRD